jgi:hypothetical protein
MLDRHPCLSPCLLFGSQMMQMSSITSIRGFALPQPATRRQSRRCVQVQALAVPPQYGSVSSTHRSCRRHCSASQGVEQPPLTLTAARPTLHPALSAVG